ncbi:hypothetical protein [Kitasatospora sp. NBC_01302]|uniref:hypothetical protein n=1 Tax=Kitasatospora sp. NBC_01302 TaxID=2903575 RepID=UPI002E12E2A8|nr:hypothetical protein OG294_19055 [Kitasatospora sp. NBC_01302]
MKIVGRRRAVLAALLVPAVGAAVICGYLWLHAADQQRDHAYAEAGAGARRYIARLQPAFAAGPQTLTSLKELEHGTSVSTVNASVSGTSVVLTLRSDVTYPSGTMPNLASTCYRVVLSRVNGSIAQQVSDSSCASWQATPDPGEKPVTDPDERLSPS